MKHQLSFSALPTFDLTVVGELLAVVETPKGSRNKYTFNHDLQGFELRKVLPRGMIFPMTSASFPQQRPTTETLWTFYFCSTIRLQWAASFA